MCRFAFFVSVLAAGCLHWAPIESLGEIQNEAVRIAREDERPMVLQHATAHGRIIEGTSAEGHEEIDVSQSRVQARRVDGVVTGLLVGAGVIATAVAASITDALILSQPRVLPDTGGF